MQRTQLESKNNNSSDVNNNSNNEFIESSRILPYKRRCSISWFFVAQYKLFSSTFAGAFLPNYSILVHVSPDRNCHTLMLRVWSSACLFIPGQEMLLLKQCEKLHLFCKQMPTLLQRAINIDQRKCRLR